MVNFVISVKIQSLVSHQLDLEKLYDKHAQAVFGFLLNLTRSEADTRDILQELFQKLATRPEMLDDVLEPRFFLIRLAHNMAIDLIRRRSTRQKNYDQFAEECSLFDANPDLDEENFRIALEKALKELPLEQRTVVHLKLWSGMTFEAISETLEISNNTAASRYRYGIDKLRELLRPLYEEIKYE